ncbi:MAG TPA: 7-cyano-7-deazaguanine synthase [Candidatus Thermoplasmatota archaeon]|nr:7-cyano-7-deazaguanine synthase [Candidatus Thermoplasmatota archaeon]
MRRALVLLSGGLDSTVALWWAAAEGYEPVALTLRYEGRPRGETRAARAILALRGDTEAHEVDLPFLREGADIDRARFSGAPPGYVPFRNALFYSLACYHAQALDCCIVVGGHNAEDAALYPDASRRFFDDLQAVLDRGAWRGGDIVPPKLVMPLLALDKDAVHALGERLGAPMELSWSCYEDGETPCGACPACARRGGMPTVARA